MASTAAAHTTDQIAQLTYIHSDKRGICDAGGRADDIETQIDDVGLQLHSTMGLVLQGRGALRPTVTRTRGHDDIHLPLRHRRWPSARKSPYSTKGRSPMAGSLHKIFLAASS